MSGEIPCSAPRADYPCGFELSPGSSCLCSLWFLFIVKILPSGWCWTIGLSSFPGSGSLCQCSGAWKWTSSLWSAMECPAISFEMCLYVMCDFGHLCDCEHRSMFLHYYRIYVVCLVLELLGSWVVVGFCVGMGAFGWTLIP